MRRLVNRRDVWGQYTGFRQRQRGHKALTLPQKDKRGQDMVTSDKLARHFGSFRRDHLIGLHATSEDETSRWLAIDIDLHDSEADNADEAARRNFAAATGWWEKLQKMGYDALLFDSNGAGGYHVWVLFEEPAPTAHVHAFGQSLISDWEARNLDARPETFPKSARLGGDKMGAWLRLPGLHHTRDHVSRVWSGESWLDEPWQDGTVAIDTMLQCTPGPPPPEPSSTEVPKKAGAPSGSSGRTRDRPAICIDLDGVLAHYHQWEGAFKIGDPVEGAVAFTQRLAENARIIVYTSRLHADDGSGDDPELDSMENAIREWLNRHGFAFHEIYRGRGKPLARAYIDDRAVSCRPQISGPHAAFVEAEAQVRELMKSR